MPDPGRKPTVSDREILRELAVFQDPVVTAPEVGDRIGMTQQGAYNRLKALEKDGLVRSKKVGSSARVWWLTDRGRQELASPDEDS